MGRESLKREDGAKRIFFFLVFPFPFWWLRCIAITASWPQELTGWQVTFRVCNPHERPGCIFAAQYVQIQKRYIFLGHFKEVVNVRYVCADLSLIVSNLVRKLLLLSSCLNSEINIWTRLWLHEVTCSFENTSESQVKHDCVTWKNVFYVIQNASPW